MIRTRSNFLQPCPDDLGAHIVGGRLDRRRATLLLWDLGMAGAQRWPKAHRPWHRRARSAAYSRRAAARGERGPTGCAGGAYRRMGPGD